MGGDKVTHAGAYVTVFEKKKIKNMQKDVQVVVVCIIIEPTTPPVAYHAMLIWYLKNITLGFR